MAIQFTGLASGLDTQSIVADLMEVENLKVVAQEKEQTRLEWKQDEWSEMNSQIYSFYKEDLFSFKSSGSYSAKTVTSSDSTAVTVSDSSSAPVGSHEIVVSQMAKGSYLGGDEIGTDLNGEAVSISTTASEIVSFGSLSEIKLHIKTEVGEASDTSNEVTISADDTIGEIIANIKELDTDLTVNFDENFNRFFVSSSVTGENVQIEFAGSDTATTEETSVTDNLLAGLGFSSTIGTQGESAMFSYNGTELTSDNNDVSVNGLSLTIRADSGTSTIAVTTNTDEIYDKIKSFIEAYNELTAEMNTKISADSASDYAVLTDDEKAAMTDDEIELWEDTIKDSLLRNDSVLTSIVTSMRSAFTTSSNVDTTDMEYNYLSDLGIVTGTYSEQGLLHIEGDADDDTYSLKTNKLRAAIEDDPDKVMELLTAIGDSVYDTLAAKMKSNSLSSAFTFYNDKYMDSQMDDYDDKIDDLEDQMDIIEARYYSQFTAMEQAIQASNSTGDWLTQQLASL